MFLLLEEHKYSKDSLIRLGMAAFAMDVSSGEAKCKCVGFHRDYERDKSVFVLPKVFGMHGKLFGAYDVEGFVNTPASRILTPFQYNRIRQTCERIYFCLRRYQRELSDSEIVETHRGQSIKSSVGQHRVTAFEAMVALIAFAKANPYIHVQTKEFESILGTNNIDWKRTLRATIPIPLKKSVLYLDPISRKVPRSQDDFLLSVFYSLLRELRAYDPTIPINGNIQCLSPTEFSRLKQRLPTILRNCRFQYYSDKLRQLHSLLQTYFDANNATMSSGAIEYLFTDDFQVIFERMVDSVLSDEDLLRQYKHLRDGKEIDHLFGHDDVLQLSRIVFVGDSKYYKDPSSIAFQKYKQFTYARNIIQEHIYVINQGSETTYTRNFRDSRTEGYNITPNFFVYGTATPDLLPAKALLSRDPNLTEFSCHFPNRLFDRDTLHIMYFRIDFVLLLNGYTGELRRQAERWKRTRQEAKEIIRYALQIYLADIYSFYVLSMEQEFVERHFKRMHGKLFTSPALYPKYLLALERVYSDENQDLLTWLANENVKVEPKSLSDLPRSF